MIAKSLIAATAVAATMAVALPASDAKADVDVTIGLGVGGYYPEVDVTIGLGVGGYYPDYYPAYRPYAYGGYGHYERYNRYDAYDRYDHGISCGKGRRIVDHSGFNNVRAIDCNGSNYRYSAWKKGHRYVVRVNRDGDITRIRRAD